MTMGTLFENLTHAVDGSPAVAVAAAVVETKLGEITDPDFLRYVKTLLGETVP